MKMKRNFGGFSIVLATWLIFMLVALVFTVQRAMAAPGDITDNSGIIPFNQAFFAFEVETVLAPLESEPIWNELEYMLDNPYAIALDPNTEGNQQGWPSYISTLPRRRSFHYRNAAGQPCPPGTPGCNEMPLPPHTIQPLNYNYQSGEELRLLNPYYAGGTHPVPADVIYPAGTSSLTRTFYPANTALVLIEALNTDPSKGPLGVPRYQQTYVNVNVSAGADRMEEDDTAITYNSPIKPDVDTTDPNTYICTVTAEVGILDIAGNLVPEGSIICGGDTGEPGYVGFGVILPDNSTQYSLSAMPGLTGPADSIVGWPLYDPARGFILPRDPVTGEGGLRKPSLRVPEFGGTPAQPNYVINSAANLEADPAALAPSNENDYIAGTTFAEKQTARDVAAALGKALFWDMQVGSDGIQACASCHFSAGVDNRTKNQLNPNHLGGDGDLEIFSNRLIPPLDLQNINQDVVVGDFPFHKLINTDIPGEPLLNPGNVISDTNDVMSSMGVVFHNFIDIPAPGPAAFGLAFLGVAPLLPDIGDPVADPIPLFQGLRRVEPRNTPTMFGAAMNFDNFWDGRARHDFNGGSVFGPTDPQHHVMVDMNDANGIQATRQIIRFSSIASLATGPALSEFEMSFAGRNWAKIGKKLIEDGVTPLANQLVSPTDSVLGPYSNQPGNPSPTPLATPAQLAARVAGKPGLCVSYAQLIQAAFYPELWQNATMHLDGGYTDGRLPAAPPQAISVLDNGAVVDSATDPFDKYVLTIADGPAVTANTNQFTQMQANMPLFFGLSVQTWVHMLVPDDTPFDRFMAANPDGFKSFGESGEIGLVLDLLTYGVVNPLTGQPQTIQPVFREVGNFKRDPDVVAYLNRTFEGDPGIPVLSGGTRKPTDPDPLMGLDFFLGSNLSLKNPNYRSLRCSECHQGETLTDHTVAVSHQWSFNDWVPEFATPGVELIVEPLGRNRVISGFALEGEISGSAQDGIERNLVDFALDVNGFPKGQALLDNGMYNLGIRPIADDVGRGGSDGFGWPLSLSYLALKNLGGVAYSPGGDNPANGFALPAGSGIPLPNFDPAIDPVGGGLFGFSAQDQLINPGFEEEPLNPLLPPYLAPWATNVNVGDEVEQDELFVALNTLCAEPILEGFVDTFGPFNPAATISETYNNSRGASMATWPNVNRVNTQGAFKAPPLRNAELTAPYFHTGSKLTLRHELDFYYRGGDFPITNSAHRDFLIMNLLEEDEALGGFLDPVTGLVVPPGTPGAVPEFSEGEKEHIIISVIEFMLEITDERVKFERAPFDHPQIIVPLDGTAPNISEIGGRAGGLLTDARFRIIPAVGAGGNAVGLPNFLNVSSVKGSPGIDHFDGWQRVTPPVAPVASAQTLTTAEDTVLRLGLTATDRNLDSLIYTIVTPPAHGTLNGGPIAWRYHPNPNFNGTDRFRFRVNDGTFNSNVATVTIGVTAVPDAPVANNDALTMRANQQRNIDVLANDTDPDGNINRSSVQIVTPPANGTAVVQNNGRIRYSPNGFVGVVTFTYTVQDTTGLTSNVATVTVTVLP